MKDFKHVSKFMSLVLRHKPEEIGLQLDPHGWVSIDELITKLNEKGLKVDLNIIQHIVINNDKKRFCFNEDNTMIRANQGHSIEVDLDLEVVSPPEFLFHGTAEHAVSIILEEGLQKRNRHHVHLTANRETAVMVGGRHGKPVVLEVRAMEMEKAGFVFFLSANNVWLVDIVPPGYLNLFNPASHQHLP